MRCLVVLFLISLSVFAGPSPISADDFLNQFSAGETGAPKKVKFYFSPGAPGKVPHQFQRLMIDLAAQGTEVEATLVDEAAYREALQEISPDLNAFELSGIESLSPASAAGLVKNHLGVPHGVTFPQHEPLKSLEQFSAEERGIFLQTLVVQNFVLLVGQKLAGQISAVPSSILSTYFYQYFGNFSEIQKFKGQGHIVVRRGDSLEMDVNPYFLFLSNFVEEGFINSAMGATIPSPTPFSLESTLANSFIFGLAKTGVDRYAARMERKYLAALAAGNERLARSIKRQQFWVMSLFFNGVVPLIRALTFLTEKTSLAPVCSAIKGGLFAIAGCHTITDELVRMGKLRFLPKKFRGEGCAKALAVLSS